MASTVFFDGVNEVYDFGYSSPKMLVGPNANDDYIWVKVYDDEDLSEFQFWPSNTKNKEVDLEFEIISGPWKIGETVSMS